MVKTKRINIIQTLIFSYFIFFPFGHLFTFRFTFIDKLIPIIPSDIIALIFLVIFCVRKLKLPKSFKQLVNFLLVAIFSQLLFISLNGIRSSLIGVLYLLRLFAYSAMFAVIWDYLRNRSKLRKVVTECLVASTFFVAIFGWLQYFIFPNIEPFTVWGWDDHLFRMVGTFIDPTFTAIILVFGIITSYGYYQKNKNNKILISLLLMLIALYFTYSRAGYLALIAGFLTFVSIQRKLKISFILVPLFILGILLLPRPLGEGVKLERTYSIKARLTNYIQTIQIAQKQPLFGVGFNNLCWAREKYFGKEDISSHSCSGSDSSLLLVLATTGIVGLFTFVYFVFNLVIEKKREIYGTVFLSSLSALFIHSIFSNSLFYPWVMGYLVFLTALAIKEYI